MWLSKIELVFFLNNLKIQFYNYFITDEINLKSNTVNFLFSPSLKPNSLQKKNKFKTNVKLINHYTLHCVHTLELAKLHMNKWTRLNY